MVAPVLYVIAGPNGIGKTTSAYDIIPANVLIINSDEIARQVRIAGIINVNVQEYCNREAQLKIVADELPNWFTAYLLPHFTPTQASGSIKALDNIEAVRQQYATLREKRQQKD